MKNLKLLALLGCLALFVITPLFIHNSYIIHLLIMVGIYILLAQGLNLILGYMGLLSLGQQAYLTIGAYISALLALRLGMSFWMTLPLAILGTMLAGLFVGYVTLRLRGPYFVIVTIGFAEIVRLLVMNIDSLGGPPGLRNIPAPVISIGSFYYSFDNNKIAYYYLVGLLVILCLFITYRLTHSREGRAFLAMRENEGLAQAVGINVSRYSMLGFLVSVAFAGVAGATFAHYVGHISPEIGAFHWTVTMLVMVVVGGQGTLIGPVIGAFIFTFLPEWLRYVDEFRLPIYGLILMLAVFFFPNGLSPMLENLGTRLTKETKKPEEAITVSHHS